MGAKKSYYLEAIAVMNVRLILPCVSYMSLSAITKDLVIQNPSAQIDMGFDRFSVQASYRDKAKRGEMFCPHCFFSGGELNVVTFRGGGNKRRDHFFHSNISSECVGYSPITEKHINAQSWLAESLQKKYPSAKIHKEFILKTDELNSRPDVLMVLEDGTNRAFEIQISKIGVMEVERRTRKLLDIGCHDVTWCFTKYSSSLEISQRLALMAQKHSLIEFNSDLSVKSVCLSDGLLVRRDLITQFRKSAKAKVPKNKTWFYNFLFYAKSEYTIFLIACFTEIRKEIFWLESKLCEENKKLVQKLLNTDRMPFRHLVNRKIYLAVNINAKPPLNMAWFEDVESDKIVTLPLSLVEAA